MFTLLKYFISQNLFSISGAVTVTATATDYLAKKQNELASSYADVAANALYALKTIEGFSDSEALQGAYNSFKAQYEQIKGLFAKTKAGLRTSYSGISTSSTSSTANTTKDYIKDYMDFQKKSLEAGKIDYQTYSRDVARFLKDMFDKGKISAKDYHDYTKEMLELQKSVYDKALSGMIYIIDKEIDSLDKEKEAIEKSYELKISKIQEEIDALEEANQKRKDQIDLEKAKYELYKAQNQRVNKLYTDEHGIIYKADTTSIRDAQETLADKKHEIAVSQLQSKIEALEKAMESEIDTIDKEIAKYEEYKEKLQNVADEYENAENVKYALAVTGLNSESKILDCRIDVLNNFAEEYFAIQQAIADAAWASANEQIKAAEAALRAQSQIGDVEASTAPVAKQEVVVVDRTNGKGNNRVKYETISKYGTGTDNADRGVHEISEHGDEIIIDNNDNILLAKGRQLHKFEGGEAVIKASDTAELLKNHGNLIPVQSPFMDIDVSKLMSNISPVIPNINMPKYDFAMTNRNMGTNVSIGDVHVHEVQNVDGLTRAILRDLPGKVNQAISRK